MSGIHLAIECVGAKLGGAATVLSGVLEEFVSDPRFERITVFSSPRGSRLFDLPGSPRLFEMTRPAEEASYARRVFWYGVGFDRLCRRLAVDVALCMNGLGRTDRTVPSITLIQQSLPFSTEALATLGFTGRRRMAVIRGLMARSCRRAAVTVVQSNVMRQWVQAGLGLADERVAVCRPRIEPFPEGEARTIVEAMERCPAGRRLLYVGNDEPYKCIDRVAKEIGALRDIVPDVRLFATIAPDHPLTRLEGVYGLGTLDRTALGRAYEMADLVVQPSLVESGPLVPAEAQSAGKPLIAANRPWAREACGAAAAYFEPLAAGSFVKVSSEVLCDADRRSAMAAAARDGWSQRRVDAGYSRLADLLCFAANTREGR